MLPIANTNVANWKLGIGIGNNGNISLHFVTPATQAFSCCPKGLFVSAERSCPKGGGQAARGGRPAVQAGASRRTPIAARRSTATAAFVVARKRTMRTRRPPYQVLDRRSLGEGGCGCVARRARQKSVVKDQSPEGLGRAANSVPLGAGRSMSPHVLKRGFSIPILGKNDRTAVADIVHTPFFIGSKRISKIFSM